MKNIKFGFIALAAVLAGTGSAYAVSASTESYTAEAISISAQPLSIEDAAEAMKTSHSGCHSTSCVPRCPSCSRIFITETGTRYFGHCRRNGRVYKCYTPTSGTF